MHTYPLSLTWRGTTATPDYARDAEAATPGKHAIQVSSAPEYAGNPARWNPEDLLGSALATCHMLTFLVLASKTKLEVTAYDDQAEAVLDTVDKVAKVVEIRLNPTIRVARGTDTGKVAELFHKAHKYCFVANSIKSKVIMNPRIVEA